MGYALFQRRCPMPDSKESGSEAAAAGSVSGAEQEYSLSKVKVQHDQAWTPNGCVTITC